MKKRHFYVVLFGLPALLAAAIVSTFLLGAAAGVLWLYVLGDNSWPSWVNGALAIGFFLVFMAVWLALLSRAYAYGKKQEATSTQTRNPREITISVGLTALLIFVIVAYQWRVNNLGGQTPEVQCAEYCHKKGFSGSSMPPRDSDLKNCNCFDARGQVVVKTPTMNNDQGFAGDQGGRVNWKNVAGHGKPNKGSTPHEINEPRHQDAARASRACARPARADFA